MAIDPVDLLLEELVTHGHGRWPTPRELKVTRTVATWRAFLESNHDDLRVVAGWPADRPYKVDPLAELIADAWADHLFDEDLDITPATTGDAGALEALLEGNTDLNGDIHEAERRVAGLGEEWWRAYVDRDIADVPLLEWHSRDSVIPLYIGRRLLAAAVVTELERPAKQRRSSYVYRHLEIHVAGLVEHVLFRGTRSRIGKTVPLETHPGLVELASQLGASRGQGQRWVHGLPMLMGRVTNGRRVDRKLNVGISDFRRITDQLLDLNEAATIAAENARLTAKRRVVVPESAIDPRPAGVDLVDRGDGMLVPTKGGTFDAGEDVYVVSALDSELGKGADGPFKVLEYSFDALPLLAHKRDLVETALTRVGLTPQYVGVVTDEGAGLALSGTALRLRLIPTTKAGRGKARPWDDTLPHVLSILAQLDALPEADGGFGRPWADPFTPPAIERGGALPTDAVEDSQVEATLVGAGVRSKETSVRNQHPDWGDPEVAAELARIREDAPSSAASAFDPGLA